VANQENFLLSDGLRRDLRKGTKCATELTTERTGLTKQAIYWPSKKMFQEKTYGRQGRNRGPHP